MDATTLSATSVTDLFVGRVLQKWMEESIGVLDSIPRAHRNNIKMMMYLIMKTARTMSKSSTK